MNQQICSWCSDSDEDEDITAHIKLRHNAIRDSNEEEEATEKCASMAEASLLHDSSSEEVEDGRGGHKSREEMKMDRKKRDKIQKHKEEEEDRFSGRQEVSSSAGPELFRAE